MHSSSLPIKEAFLYIHHHHHHHHHHQGKWHGFPGITLLLGLCSTPVIMYLFLPSLTGNLKWVAFEDVSHWNGKYDLHITQHIISIWMGVKNKIKKQAYIMKPRNMQYPRHPYVNAIIPKELCIKSLEITKERFRECLGRDSEQVEAVWKITFAFLIKVSNRRVNFLIIYNTERPHIWVYLFVYAIYIHI